MTSRKLRVTVTLDPDLVDAGQNAVASGAAESLSAWVSSALSEKVRREQKLRHLGAAIGDYESEHGEITTDEIAALGGDERTTSVVVHSRPSTRGRRKRSA